jgi:hypothetical protein
MSHYLFNFSSGDRAAALARLGARVWGIGDDEPYRDALAPGDLVLIYVATFDGGFIGRAELATGVHEFAPSERRAYPDDSQSGVGLADVERWDRVVPMATVVARVDPTASNPVVQANARAGFRTGVVRITGEEYEAASSASREYQGPQRSADRT